MDTRLTSFGYDFEPSKYSPDLAYSRLRVLISGQPTQRFFDTKVLHVPTFDGRFYHRTQVTRHELAPQETFQVCLGQISLEPRQGEPLRAFSFGGVLQAKVEQDDLYCELTSSAPIFKLQEDPKLGGGVIAGELMDLLAEIEAQLGGHEDELFSRLAKFEPYPLFLASIVSLQKRAEIIPLNARSGRYQQASTILKRLIQAVRDKDGWDGTSPSLENLLGA